MKIFGLIFLIFVSTCSAQNKTAKKDTVQYQLQQITVSATRYEENLMEIPYAVNVFTQNHLESIRGYGFDEILKNIPGIFSQSRFGNQDVRIVIRGFGARGAGDRSNSGTTRGIRVMLDGIPETEPDGRTSFDEIDLSLAGNVEVVRSNASALWGNASGGIINVSSVPEFNNYFIKSNAMFGSYGFRKYSLQAGSEIGNGKLFFSVANSVFDGWRKHSGSARTVVNLGLNSDLSTNSKLGVFLVGSTNIFHIPGPLSEEEFQLNPSNSNSVYEARDERRFNRLGRFGVTFSHNFNEHNEISAMSFVGIKFLQRSERNTFRDFTRYHTGGNIIYRNTSYFSKLKNNLTIGIDEAYQDGAILFYTLSATNGRGDKLKSDKREGANNFGVFLQDEVNLNENLSFILGARYDNITYSSEDFFEPKLGLQKKSFERITPKLGLTYLLTPNHSIYANLGGGVEVPAGNETNPVSTFGQDTVHLLNPLLEPINSTTIELGTKQILLFDYKSFVKAVSYDLAFYYININNDIIPFRGGAFYLTAGRTNRYGAELGTTFQFAEGLSISSALTLSNNEYKEYLIDSVHYGKPGKFADLSGNKSAGIPDFFYNVNVNYQPGWFSDFSFTINFHGVNSYFADDQNSISVPRYDLINLTLSYKNPLNTNSGLILKSFLTINNLTDKLYAASAFINPELLNGKPVYLEAGLPRTVTFSIQLAWEK